ncbi:tetratricopeptide repeat-containing sensor histidine kinase [Polaribacter uvawellassae]|uniref:tetratricopeptide repeat-containing sensor histidine kinase n=1 Tax=Polaribacter uvawellassae TaxID=3133495 RepID=UPI00321B07DC
MYYKRISIVFVSVFLFFSATISSQQKQIEAIKKQLSTEQLSDSLKIKLLGDLGWYYGNVNIDSSYFYTKKGLQLALKTNNQKGIGQSYNDIGIIYYRTSRFDSAITYYNKSLKIRKKLNDSVGIAGLYSKIGITFQQTSTLDSALFYNNKSLRVYESLGMTRFVAVNQNNSANIYLNLKQYDKALEMHFKVLKGREITRIPSELSESYINIGNVYQQLLDFKNSKKYYNLAIPIAEKNNLIRQLSIVYNNYGNIYKEENNIKQALVYYQKAYVIRKKLSDDFGLASVIGNLGTIYFEVGQFKKAENYYFEGATLAKRIGAKELELSSYRGLLQLKSFLKQPDSTVFYQKKYDDLNNIIRNENVTKQVAEIETKYETEKKEKEIALQKEQLLESELKVKNRNLYAILITAILLLLGILYYGFYKRNKLKREQLQKEIDLKDALATIKTQNQLQEQRLRISRDLHDNIGSQLTFIISSIDNLKFITKDANEKLKDKLSSISSFTSDTIFQLRDTIWAMNKSEISAEDLHARILSFIEKAKTAAENTEFILDNSINPDKKFTSLVGINLFRVVQEAINNSIKYAEASEIKIELYQEKNQITISIKDNGKGFDKNTIVFGNGLSNMEKRMSEIGGKITIGSEEKRGTKIKIVFNT